MAGVKGRSGRKAGYVHNAKARESIRLGMLLSKLEAIALGEEASSQQVTAALGLLKKVMPDLQAIQHTGEDGGPLTVVVNKLAAKE